MFHAKTFKKGEFLVKENNYCNELSFVSSGIFRIYSNYEDKEITQWLSGTNSFVTEISSFLFEQASRWNIQAIEDCNVFSISKTDYKKIASFVPRWNEMEKLFIAKCFATLESRVFSHLAMNAEERFLLFSSLYPDLISSVPLQYLASLLGMTPETLSRIRKKQSTS
ncbi:MAG: CRP-like cAMP-binding protein [Chitinophagales bacterium]